jgi:hypothetical protein
MVVESPTLQWQYDAEHDTNDGKPWSTADLEDLALALKDGGTIEGAALFVERPRRPPRTRGEGTAMRRPRR